nr:hypothetical protein [Candidatus Levybacteria bacterium]
MTEKVRKSGEITRVVEPGQRTNAFHREQDMSMDEGGYLAIDNQGDTPTATYYVIETPGRIGWGLLDVQNIDKAFKDWEAGITNAPQAQDEFTRFTPKWTREFDPNTRSLSIETKDENGIHPLVITAQSAIPQQV